MSGFFDDSHVTDVGLQGSMGRSVGFLDMVKQGFRQQYHVDSQMALDSELNERWKESLRALQAANGESFQLPADPLTYRGYAQYINGQPITVFPTSVRGDASQAHTNPYEVRNAELVQNDNPEELLSDIIRANEAIKKLNNPNVKSFEAILEDVARMQADVEEESSSMYERTGKLGVVGNLLGAAVGSFTMRDPLNVVTAPIGAGRTIATKIAWDMGIAGAVTAATEYRDVAPNRALVGLPERDSLFNVGAAAFGAGALRGVLEGVAKGIGAVRTRATPDIDFDLRDTQLQQMFEANAASPRARAGASILDDATFIEKNNPYGEGHLANVRFIAELQSVQRAMNGEPMTAIARVMPEVPFEYVQKAADFDIVKERSPELYAKMETAQAKLRELKENKLELYHGTTAKFDEFDLAKKGTGASKGIKTTIADGIYLTGDKELAENFVKGKPGANVKTVNVVLRNPYILREGELITHDLGERLKQLGHDGIIREFDNKPLEVVVFDPKQIKSADALKIERRSVNKEYQAAYRAVEAEAARLNFERVAAEVSQQAESSTILASQGLPFTGPLLRYDNVQALADRINAFNDTLDEATAARFVRETLGEGENKIEVEVWEKDGGIDIGLKDPVDPDFRFVTDEGEMTVAQAMRDLQDDTDLVEAIKVCAI